MNATLHNFLNPVIKVNAILPSVMKGQAPLMKQNKRILTKTG
jgi:hypothetical protein